MSLEEGAGRVAGDCIDGYRPGDTFQKVQDASDPKGCGEEMWELKEDASWRCCHAGGLGKLKAEGDWLDYNGGSLKGCGDGGG